MFYRGNIETDTLKNEDFRRVLFTAGHMQLVVMTLQPGESIGMEMHSNVDQFFRIEQGTAKFRIAGVESTGVGGASALVPAGTYHNITNVGVDKLKLYTLYTPPNHKPGTIEPKKEVTTFIEKRFLSPAAAVDFAARKKSEGVETKTYESVKDTPVGRYVVIYKGEYKPGENVFVVNGKYMNQKGTVKEYFGNNVYEIEIDRIPLLFKGINLSLFDQMR